MSGGISYQFLNHSGNSNMTCLCQPILMGLIFYHSSYRRAAHFNTTHVRRQAFYALPSQHWGLLVQPPFSILNSLSKLDDLIDDNAELAEAIFTVGFRAFIAPGLDSEWVASVIPQKVAHDEFLVYSTIMDCYGVKAARVDIEKAVSCVNQFYREWSAEGELERSRCYSPVIEILVSEFMTRKEISSELSRSDLSILVPGAGLGRLVFDVCRAGFTVEGNEISYHALMASSLALNHTSKVGEYTVAPFALNCSNHLSRADQFRTFEIPDIHPGNELLAVGPGQNGPAHERMSMSTGDFCVLYSNPDSKEAFDAVATVFFIDTAPNIIRYIEAVHNCLKPNGLWVNLGPLLWHHATRSEDSDSDDKKNKVDKDGDVDKGIADPGSVELTDEEVVALVQHLGFTIEKHEPGAIQTGYITNTNSMLQSTYHSSLWVARKK